MLSLTIFQSLQNVKNRKIHTGDAFAPHNQYALKIDRRAEPPMFQVSDIHYAATWLLDPRAPHEEMPEGLSRRIRQMEKGEIKHAAR